MITMFEQKESEKGKQLRSKGKREYYFSNAIIFYKHLLKCTTCTWNITYSEHSGSLDVSNNSVFCPVCKDGKIESSKYMLNSNNSYI